MRKLLVVGLMVIMMFLAGIDVVVAADLPGDPPGDGGGIGDGVITPRDPISWCVDSEPCKNEAGIELANCFDGYRCTTDEERMGLINPVYPNPTSSPLPGQEYCPKEGDDYTFPGGEMDYTRYCISTAVAATCDPAYQRVGSEEKKYDAARDCYYYDIKIIPKSCSCENGVGGSFCNSLFAKPELCDDYSDKDFMCGGSPDYLFNEGDYRKGLCFSDLDECISACGGPSVPPPSYNVYECNPNLFDPNNPIDNGDWGRISLCIGVTDPASRAQCLAKRTCWIDNSYCHSHCEKMWYCDPLLDGCRHGFFARIDPEGECSSKTGSLCFRDKGQCQMACDSCTPQCPGTYCDGEEIPDGCGGLCPTTECNIELVEPPGLGVGTPGGLIINPDESGRNHICEMDASGEERFFASNTVRFSFVLDGWSEDESKMGVVGIGFNNLDDDNVLTMTMALFGGSPFEAFPPTGTSAGYVLGTAGTRLLPEIGREFFFDITFLDGFDDNLNFAWVSAVTGNGTTLPWTFTGRSFKVWDCKVPVSGAMYDGTVEEGGDVCIDGFSEKVEADFYDSLTFRRLGNNPEDFEMTVNSPDYESDGNSLDWGFSYNHLFGNLDGDSENILLKVTDVGGSSSCDALLNLGTRVDPYSTLPSAVVDFALAVNPDPWFQSIDGGVQAGGNFTNTVPVTCASNPDCVEASVISGLLAAGGSMNKGCSDCSFASPDTWVNKNMVTGSFAYQYFYNEYFVKLGQGTTMSGESTMTDLGEEAKGIYFIDGDFFVDKNNTLTTASSDYLIIIAKGRIIFEEDVEVSSGIFIADGDIEARGEGSSNLTIEGMLFSTNGNVRLSRGYANRSMNRSNPGVLVRFRPDYLFKLPGEITRVLSGWRER